MGETHASLESVWEHLWASGQSCWRRIKAAIQIFEKLQTTTYIKFDFLDKLRDKYVKKLLLQIQN